MGSYLISDTVLHKLGLCGEASTNDGVYMIIIPSAGSLLMEYYYYR